MSKAVSATRDRELYHAVALATYGPLPVVCRCGKPVHTLGEHVDVQHRDIGVVHHKNENHQDNRPENLEIMHFGCHQRHHKTGKRHAPEVIEQIRQKNRGRKQSPEEIARRSVSLRGRKTSAETRAKISAANRGRECSSEMKQALSEHYRGKLVGAATMQSKCLTCGKVGARGPMGMHAKHKAHEVVPA